MKEKEDDILNSLTGLQRAKFPEGLADRIMESYRNRPVNIWERALLTISNPMFAAACILAIIMINLFLVVTGNEVNTSPIANTDLTTANATLFDNDSYTKP